MIIVCEGCGKQYRIDPDKIKDKKAKMKCKACSHVIIVNKPDDASEPPPAASAPLTPATETKGPGPDDGGAAKKAEAESSKSVPERRKTKRKGLGLRSKMIFLFFVVPILIIISASAFYLWQLNKLALLITDDSTQIVTKLAEDSVAEMARAAAMQCKIYLEAHPDLQKEDFNYDMKLKSLAVQKIGMTGFSMLYEVPGSDGVWRAWAHVDPSLIGTDMIKLKKILGDTFKGFWKILTGVKGGKISRGYHSWQDRDGSLREKFMVSVPIEGTPYVIAAITYLDEFTRSVKVMESRAEKQTEQVIMVIAGILAGAVVFIMFIVVFYGYKLTGRIQYLTDVADRISVGDLDAKIEMKTQDEIGELADAISRMQDSIRLSIERLRRRR